MLIYADKVFENPIEVIEAFCPNQVKSALDKVEFLKNKGLYLVGYMRYNLKNIADNLPLVYFTGENMNMPIGIAIMKQGIRHRSRIAWISIQNDFF